MSISEVKQHLPDYEICYEPTPRTVTYYLRDYDEKASSELFEFCSEMFPDSWRA